jgi:hypothetical protein
MESKEKCEQIIQIFNGNPLAGSKEPLLVKFADGGNKKRSLYKSPDQRLWRDGGEVSSRLSYFVWRCRIRKRFLPFIFGGLHPVVLITKTLLLWWPSVAQQINKKGVSKR